MYVLSSAHRRLYSLYFYHPISSSERKTVLNVLKRESVTRSLQSTIVRLFELRANHGRFSFCLPRTPASDGIMSLSSESADDAAVVAAIAARLAHADVSVRARAVESLQLKSAAGLLAVDEAGTEHILANLLECLNDDNTSIHGAVLELLQRFAEVYCCVSAV
jgi:hypothetical protein